MNEELKIGFDLDDVLVPYMKYFWDFCHNHLGYKNITPLDQMTSTSFEKLLGVDGDTMDKIIKEFEQHENWIKIHNHEPHPECIQLLTDLKQNGHTLFIITAREERYHSITHECISRFFPEIFTDVVFCNIYRGNGKKETKSSVCKRLGCSILIDDNLDHVREVRESGIQGIAFGSNNWTKSDPDHIKTWGELREILL